MARVTARIGQMALLVGLAGAIAASAASVSAAAPSSCRPLGYAYAGLQATGRAYGVTADLSLVRSPAVSRGHVAAWIGVGALGEGPNGADEWLQIGLNRVAGDTDKLYYEVAQPWGKRYVELASDVPANRRFHVAVLEVHGWRSVWRVWVDGRPVSKPIWLPASHGALTPMAIAESWDDGTAACNEYAYSFRGISLAERPGGTWAPLPRRDTYVMEDPGYRIVRQTANGFVATGTGRAGPAALGRRLEARTTAAAGRSGEGRSRSQRARIRRSPEPAARAR
jgi:hypothetical protein